MSAVLASESTGDLHRPGAMLRSPTEALRTTTLVALVAFVFTVPTASMLVVSWGAGTVSRVVGIVALPLALLAVALGGRRYRWLDVHVAMVALGLWAAMSSFWTLDAAATMERSLTLVQLVALLVLIWEFGSDHGRWRALLWAYLAGCAVACVQLLQAAALGAELHRGRYSFGGFNPNDLVQVLVLGVPIATYLGITASSPLRRALAWAHVPLLVVAVVLTGSRQGVLLLPAALAAIPFALRHVSRRARLTVLVGVLAAGSWLFSTVPTETFDRLGSVGDEVTEGDLGGRSELRVAAIAAADQRPLTGVGEGALERVISRTVGHRAGAHNTYLSIAGELGVVGLAFFLIGLVAALVHALRYPPEERILAVTVWVVLVLSLLPGHNEHDKSTWFALAIVVAPSAACAPSLTYREHVRRMAVPPLATTTTDQGGMGS
jgi:O-antigen ligase